MALSSAEAELVELKKLAMEMLGIRSIHEEWGMMTEDAQVSSRPTRQQP